MRPFVAKPLPTANELAITPETAFAEPVNVRLSGWTYRATYCLRLLRAQRVTAKAIGLQLGCSQGAVHSQCAKLNITLVRTPRKAKAAPRRVVGHKRSPNGLHRMLIGFDEETFEMVRDIAEANQCSFGEQVRLLVQWGLEAT